MNRLPPLSWFSYGTVVATQREYPVRLSGIPRPRQAYALACEETEGVRPETRVRAGLFVEQYEVMYGDACAAIERLQVQTSCIKPSERSPPTVVSSPQQSRHFRNGRTCSERFACFLPLAMYFP